MEASVLLEGIQSRWFEADEGLKESFPLSPLLYHSIYVTNMVEELEKRGLGVKVENVWSGTY